MAKRHGATTAARCRRYVNLGAIDFRTAGRAACLIVAAVSSLLLPLGTALAAKPSFVIVLTDDMATDEIAALPSVASLIGSQGITFAQSFVSDPLCSPDRATLLTGQYATIIGILTNAGTYSQFTHLERQTLAVLLHHAGWHTALIGKYINLYHRTDFARIPPGWNRWFVGVNNFQDSVGWAVSDQGVLVQEGNAFTTDVLLQKATQFIRNNASRPFLLDFAPSSPHEPCPAAARDAGRFFGATVPRTPAFNEADVSDKPSFMQFPSMDPAAIANADAHFSQCLRALASVDNAVRTLVATLTEVGKLASTYIIFTNDNGYHYGEHRLPFGKQAPYETDLRVPLIVSGPGVPKGVVDNTHIVVNADLAPTILTLASLAVPGSVDGRSLRPLLLAKPLALPWRQSFPIEHAHSDTELSAPWPDFRGVHTQRYSWVEWADGQRELYDLPADPDELSNLANMAGLDDLSTQLSGLSAGLATCMGLACREIERQPAP